MSNVVAKVLGRLIGVLIDKAIITKEEATYILEPLEEGDKE